jgi:hypothetical protein
MLKISYRQKKKRPMEEPKGLKNEEVNVNVKGGLQEKFKGDSHGSSLGGLTHNKKKMDKQQHAEEIGLKNKKEWTNKNMQKNNTRTYKKTWEDKNEVDRYIYEKMIKKTEKIIPISQKTDSKLIEKEQEQRGTQKTTWKEEYKQVWKKISGAKGYISKTETKEGKEKKNKGRGIIEIGGKIKGMHRIATWRNPAKGNTPTKNLTETNGKEENESLKEMGIIGIVPQQITDKTGETQLSSKNNKQGKQMIQETPKQTTGGKGIEIEYSEIMKIKKKYKGEYVNKAHIFEMLSGLCKKIIKWEEEKGKEIKEKKEKIKNVIKKNLETGKNKNYEIQQENPFITAGTNKEQIKYIQNIKTQGTKEKELPLNSYEMENTQLTIEENIKEEGNLIKKELGNWRKTKEEGKKINKGNPNPSIIPKRNKITYITKKDTEETEITWEKMTKNVHPIKWISKGILEEAEKGNNKKKSNILKMISGDKKIAETTNETNTLKEQTQNENIKNKTERKIKAIEYIIKTKNMYGAIQYLKNYWKHIENKYFPKKGGKPTKKIQLISTSWNVNWLKEKGNKKCIIKRKLLEQKMKKIIEKQNKKPIIGICENKEGGKIGRKKMKNAKIIKEEIMFIDAIKTMENIKW